jgi:hypothetical protein
MPDISTRNGRIITMKKMEGNRVRYSDRQSETETNGPNKIVKRHQKTPKQKKGLNEGNKIQEST